MSPVTVAAVHESGHSVARVRLGLPLYVARLDSSGGGEGLAVQGAVESLTASTGVNMAGLRARFFDWIIKGGLVLYGAIEKECSIANTRRSAGTKPGCSCGRKRRGPGVPGMVNRYCPGRMEPGCPCASCGGIADRVGRIRA